MRKIYVSRGYNHHTCFDCVDYDCNNQRCGYDKSIYNGVFLPSSSVACAKIQFHSIDLIKRKKKKVINSIYDLE